MQRFLLMMDTAQRAGAARIVTRLNRSLRYRFLYPLCGNLLFPITKQTGDASNKIPDLKCFDEADAASILAKRQAFISNADKLVLHEFSFLNLPAVALDHPVSWNSAPFPEPLWTYNLHYGEWALLLAQAYLATGDGRYSSALMNLISDWLRQNPVGKGAGWEPYPLSRRIVAWLRVASIFRDSPEWQRFWKEELANSLALQARVLAANLETDISNNHLIANFKALAWAGLLMPSQKEAIAWQKIGLDGLWSEAKRQVLEDGVHDERSISYHTIVLQDLLETWHLCRSMGVSPPADIEPLLLKMIGFLCDMQAPDGSFPTLNDSVEDYPMDPRSVILAGGHLFQRAEWIESARGADSSYAVLLGCQVLEKPSANYTLPVSSEISVYPSAGYAVLKDEDGGRLYFDAGPMGPHHLPGHGHADALSISLFAKGHWLLVDPGVYSYHDEKWRNHFRSTIVHNTVTVDNQDQCVFWGPFRVAYPYQSKIVESSDNHVTGEHDGYRRLSNPVIHRREVQKTGRGEWQITDMLEGIGSHNVTLTFQYAPGVKIEAIEGKVVLSSWPDGARLKIDAATLPEGATINIDDGWVSRRWYEKEQAPCLKIQGQMKLPVMIKVLLTVTN